MILEVIAYVKADQTHVCRNNKTGKQYIVDLMQPGEMDILQIGIGKTGYEFSEWLVGKTIELEQLEPCSYIAKGVGVVAPE